METILRSAVLGMFLLGHCLLGAAAEVRFDEHIRPILAEHCLHCHGPDEDKREGGLRLDIEGDAKEFAIVAHRTDQSTLIERIASDDPELKMPPQETGKPLTSDQISLLRQ